MIVTNRESGTNLNEIADSPYRINTPITLPDGSGFSFNQYLIGAPRRRRAHDVGLHA